MVNLYEADDKVEEVWQVKIIDVRCQLVHDNIKVHLDSLTKSIIAYR